MQSLIQRISFRPLLLVTFVLIGGLLGAASLSALYTLEGLMAESRNSAAQSVQLTSAAQSLNERSVDMERALRQSILLDDKVLRQRYGDAVANTGQTVDRLRDKGLIGESAARWHQQIDLINSRLGSTDTSIDRDQALANDFRELQLINTAISQEVQQVMEQRGQQLIDRQEGSRRMLTQQIVGAIGLAALLALVFGIWLTRPLKKLERAIVGLGENRLEQPIEIHGPSDLQLVGQRLDWLRLRLAELDADKARFLRHVSHEIKTPLAALREGVSLLEDGVAGELSPNQREIARILRQNTSVLQSQIEDLLRFNAAAFEASQLQRRKIDLLALVQQQIDNQRLQLQGHGIQVDLRGEPVTLDIDEDKVGTAVANLLSNAIRFSPEGGTIAITLERPLGLVSLSIQDQGPGVAEADRERIFEPFYRGSNQPADAVRGSGIGLSIVHEYIAAHGGQIRLVSNDSGACFIVEFPHVA
ncbi:MAG: Sensor histidine kinase GlrK [Paracidovorax wautersii]|uniref:Signal transduction histidine-protein kinase/phosphatase MprB n=1 Tax=Paracidovorax wautersii TaxID=1177982 RepID=A0A7V8FPA2_9BURK|nr:MAG: Sensor histidine kinase GlrK [Paracidovorax wautersii]